jgi:hypothetical protein
MENKYVIGNQSFRISVGERCADVETMSSIRVVYYYALFCSSFSEAWRTVFMDLITATSLFIITCHTRSK